MSLPQPPTNLKNVFAGYYLALFNYLVKFGIYMAFNSGAGSFYRGPNVDLSSFSIAPYTFDNTQSVNFGTFAFVGAGAQVDVTGNFLADTPIEFFLQGLSVTPSQGLYFSAAQTAGHFHVKANIAASTDTYGWQAL